jgi:hypothetical protein
MLIVQLTKITRKRSGCITSFTAMAHGMFISGMVGQLVCKIFRMPRIKKEPKRPWKLDSQPARQNKRADPFYTNAAWRKLRNQYIEANPLCEHHLEYGNYVEAKIVDHKKPRSQRPDLELDWNNLQSLCQRCHQQKTAKEKQ